MKDQIGFLKEGRIVLLTFSVISLTVLICASPVLQSQLVSSPSATTGLAFAAGPSNTVGLNNSISSNNSSQAKSTSSLTGAAAASNTKTLQYISNARQLLNQTLAAYQKQNFTGALDLATKAYLDNFEFVETPIQQHDKALKQNTELMMRGDLRSQIRHQAPISDIKTLLGKINTNLDKAEKLFSGQ
jgi:hypothetical protein